MQNGKLASLAHSYNRWQIGEKTQHIPLEEQRWVLAEIPLTFILF